MLPAFETVSFTSWCSALLIGSEVLPTSGSLVLAWLFVVHMIRWLVALSLHSSVFGVLVFDYGSAVCSINQLRFCNLF